MVWCGREVRQVITSLAKCRHHDAWPVTDTLIARPVVHVRCTPCSVREHPRQRRQDTSTIRMSNPFHSWAPISQPLDTWLQSPVRSAPPCIPRDQRHRGRRMPCLRVLYDILARTMTAGRPLALPPEQMDHLPSWVGRRRRGGKLNAPIVPSRQTGSYRRAQISGGGA